MKGILFLINLVFVAVAREIILSSGLDSWDHQQLLKQYNAYNTYANQGIVTASSILVYGIDPNGYLNQYNTTDPTISAEQYQVSLQKLGLRSYPCIYCDATIPISRCKNLNVRMERLYEHKHHFINDTIQRAIKYNWNGYTIDLEPDHKMDSLKVSHFIVEWASRLKEYNLTLYVWIGATTVFNLNILSEAMVDIKMITMDTYTDNYNAFIGQAGNTLIASSKPQNIGFGLLTNVDQIKNKKGTFLNESDMINLASWTKISTAKSLSIWASIIPPQWFKGLKEYITD